MELLGLETKRARRRDCRPVSPGTHRRWRRPARHRSSRLQQPDHHLFQRIHHLRILRRRGYHRPLFRRHRQSRQRPGCRQLIPRDRQPSLRWLRIRSSEISCWGSITSIPATGLIASRPKIELVFRRDRKPCHTASNHAASVRRQLKQSFL